MHAIQNLIHKFFKYGIGGTGSKTGIPGKYVTNIGEEMPPPHFFLAERLNFPIFLAPQYNAWGWLNSMKCSVGKVRIWDVVHFWHFWCIYIAFQHCITFLRSIEKGNIGRILNFVQCILFAFCCSATHFDVSSLKA